MDLRRLSTWIWIILLPMQGVGQQGRLLFNHLLVQDGLSETTNTYVYKDSKGFVWISSIAGLIRFDGSQVHTYYTDINSPCALFGDNIQSPFFEDDSSRIWFSTYEAINVYDRRQDCFHHYQIDRALTNAFGYYVFALDADHALWLLCADQVYTFDLKSYRFTRICNVNHKGQRALAIEDGAGCVTQIYTYFIGFPGVERTWLNQDYEVQQQENIQGVKPGEALPVRKVLAQGDSLIWVLSDRALQSWSIQHGKSRYHSFDQHELTTFEWMDDTTLLIGTQRDGILEYNVLLDKIVFYYTHQADDVLSLADNEVNHISRDRDDGIWVTTWGIGISYSYPGKKKFNTFLPQDTSTNLTLITPTNLLPAKENELFCPTTKSGFFYLRRDGIKCDVLPIRELANAPFAKVVYQAYADYLGNYWISSFFGFSVFDPVKGRVAQVSRDSFFIPSCIPLPDGHNLFSSSGKSLFLSQGDWEHGFKIIPTPAVLDSNDYPFSWLDRSGRIWVSDLQKIHILDSATFVRIALLPVTGMCYKRLEVTGTPITWISSSTGLYEIDADQLKVIKVHTDDNGMPATSFTSMEMDKHGHLWLPFNVGMMMFDPVHDSTRIYSWEDGLPQAQYTSASFQFPDGELWFGANKGITRFYPDQIHDVQILATPQITEIQVNDQAPAQTFICEVTGSTNVTEVEKLTFHYRDNTLSFRVNAMEYSAPKYNKVAYKMENLDEHEVKINSGRLIRYANMPPGHYQFLVYAYNSDGIRNPVPHRLALYITPPFYKTIWFMALVILASGGILAYIIYLRFSKTLELQRVRLKLYENLHDDVGSRLTAIVLSAEELERQDQIHNPKLQSIAQIAKSIVGNMRRLVWAIDPENDKVINIMQKINHDRSQILPEEVRFQMEVDEHIKHAVVPGEIRYQISSICNEALNNIAKYAAATEVTVRIAKEKNLFKLFISDNGKGFDPDSKNKNVMAGTGYGLNNMRRRASRVKGNLEIWSRPGQGTRIEATFPV